MNDDRRFSEGIQRIGELGDASEQVFNRLYRLGKRGALSADDPRQRVAEADLERLIGVLARLDQGIIVQDSEGRLILANEAARRLLGNIRAFWDSDLGRLYDRFRSSGPLTPGVAPLSDATPVVVGGRSLGAQLAAIADGGGARVGTLIVLRDTSADGLAQRLREQFISAISHELRTPMTVIKGVSDVIQHTDKPDRRLLDSLAQSVGVLDRMIVDLLDLTQLEGGVLTLRNEPLALEPLLWQVVNGMKPEIERGHLDVAVLVRDARRLRVIGDDQRLRWALGHVFGNAIRFTPPEGHIVLTARVSADGDGIIVQCVDTGIGIAEDDLPRVFERFYRGDARDDRGRRIDARGLGQGLYIAKRVIEAHGGQITATSPRRRGTILTILLPKG